eukprot:9482131-Pyramimonas_sp.AAC.1
MFWSVPESALSSRIEGVALVSSADGGGRAAEGGGSRTRLPPQAEAGGRPAEAGGSIHRPLMRDGS